MTSATQATWPIAINDCFTNELRRNSFVLVSFVYVLPAWADFASLMTAWPLLDCG
jgi:hypothetical protein